MYLYGDNSQRFTSPTPTYYALATLVQIPIGTCKKVTSELELGGGFPWVLTHLQLTSHDNPNMADKVTIKQNSKFQIGEKQKRKRTWLTPHNHRVVVWCFVPSCPVGDVSNDLHFGFFCNEEDTHLNDTISSKERILTINSFRPNSSLWKRVSLDFLLTMKLLKITAIWSIYLLGLHTGNRLQTVTDH